MQSITTAAIVCRYANYRDYDRMLTLLTPQHGVIDAVARACRRPKSPLFAGCQLFACGEYVLTCKQGRYTAAQFDLTQGFTPLGEDFGKLSIATYAAALCARQVPEASDMYSLCYYALSFLCFGSVHPVDLLICFTVKYLLCSGYALELYECVKCRKPLKAAPYFAAERGGVLCEGCARATDLPLPVLGAEALRRMEALPMQQMDKVQLPGELRGPLLRAAMQSVEYHVEAHAKNQQLYKTIMGEYGADM